jgi:hypothetical protein
MSDPRFVVLPTTTGLRAGDQGMQPQQRSLLVILCLDWGIGGPYVKDLARDNPAGVSPYPTYSPSSQIIRVPYFTG